MNEPAGLPGIRLQTFGGLVLTSAGQSIPQFGPKRLTFLTVPAATGVAGLPKERLSALRWPHSDDERARNSLHQLPYVFRHAPSAETSSRSGLRTCASTSSW